MHDRATVLWLALFLDSWLALLTAPLGTRLLMHISNHGWVVVRECPHTSSKSSLHTWCVWEWPRIPNNYVFIYDECQHDYVYQLGTEPSNKKFICDDFPQAVRIMVVTSIPVRYAHSCHFCYLAAYSSWLYFGDAQPLWSHQRWKSWRRKANWKHRPFHFKERIVGMMVIMISVWFPISALERFSLHGKF